MALTDVFAGRVALVTGGGSGVGAAAARALASEGAAVAVFDLDGAAAERVAGDVAGTGGSSLALAGDVGVAGHVARAVSATVEAFGGLDVVVSNAGIARTGELPEFGEDDWDAVITTNLKGPFLITKYAVPELRKRGGGSIVHTASVQGIASQPGVAAYAASKGGLIAMVRTTALDHARDGIRVNCVAPGSVRTTMLQAGAAAVSPENPDAVMDEWGALHPLGRVIEPAEVAAVILFLAGPGAAAVTGSCYVVDGGLIAKLAL
jgi:meso-butanediol dehydrogenase/(S,S)-butanediol dehydrogenase/diacetyl reductase